MMNKLQYLRQQLELLELPIAYYAFPEGVTTLLPYLIFDIFYDLLYDVSLGNQYVFSFSILHHQ